MIDVPEAVATQLDHLIGNLYLNFAALPIVAERLNPDALPSHLPGATLYAEMCRLYLDPNQQLSMGNLESALRARHFDTKYLVGLQSRILNEPVDKLLGYVDTLNNWADLRELDRNLNELRGMIDKPGARADQLVPEAMRLLATGKGSGEGGFVSLTQAANDLLPQVPTWRDVSRRPGLPTGYVDLDRIVRLMNSYLILIAARPSMGKTALGMGIAENVARWLPRVDRTGVVAVFSAEMSTETLTERMACSIAGVNGHRLRNGEADADEYRKFEGALRDLSAHRLPIYIDDRPAPTVDQMYYRAAMLNARIPVRAILFDFVELGGDKPEKRSDGEEQRISGIAKGLKNLAKALNVPVVALSQLNRDVETTQDKLPALSNLRYSGMLEQVSDVAMFIMRPEYYISRGDKCFVEDVPGWDKRGKLENHPHAKGVAYVIVAKHRNGPTGRVNLTFIEKYTKFANYQGEVAA